MRPAVVLVLALAAGALASDDGRMEVAGLRFAVPSGWERVQPTSPMRAAQFRIPRAGRKQEDGELLLFGYSPRKGGSASDLAERWYAQFTQPDGKVLQGGGVGHQAERERSHRRGDRPRGNL